VIFDHFSGEKVTFVHTGDSEFPYANINDADGRLVTGSYIRPLTFEFQLNFKF